MTPIGQKDYGTSQLEVNILQRHLQVHKRIKNNQIMINQISMDSKHQF